MTHWYGPHSYIWGATVLDDLAVRFERLVRQLKNPYHPERHYMRG